MAWLQLPTRKWAEMGSKQHGQGRAVTAETREAACVVICQMLRCNPTLPTQPVSPNFTKLIKFPYLT